MPIFYAPLAPLSLDRSRQTNQPSFHSYWLAAHYDGGHRGAGSIPLMSESDQQIRMVVAELKANE